jgi:hypothetical protein
VKWYVSAVSDRETYRTLFMFSIEAWFNVNGYVNSQNDGFRLLIYEIPLHDVTFGVWCAVCAIRTLGRIFVSPCIQNDFLHIFRHQFLNTCSIRLNIVPSQCNKLID